MMAQISPGAAMDMADMTAMEPRAYFSFGSNTYVHLSAGTPALMLLSTFLPGLAIGVLKGMMFSVLLDKIEKKPHREPSHYHQSRYPMQKSLPLLNKHL